ncbi:exo-alpha-sialidase [Nonomuraea sp. NPDC046570]|uniref:exo-alpha-sialidase n=1 Tax=Nonomuraea sp. NPDC046570 TaxID=3155255 RepID=UPI0033EFA98A
MRRPPIVLILSLLAVLLVPLPTGPAAAATAPSVDNPTVPDISIVSPANSPCVKWNPDLDNDPNKTVREENEVVPCAWFPSIVTLPNGDLYLAYSWSISHSHSGAIAARRSTDGGLTWSAQQIIASDPDPLTVDLKEPSLTVLRDGTLVMAYYDYRPARGNRRQVYVTRSTDNGATWSPRIVPPTLMYDSGKATVSVNGEIVELANGDLLLPIYGWRHYDGSLGGTAAHVLRSRDGGLTWDRADERVVMWEGPVYVRDVTVLYNEPALADLGGGHLMMVARTTNNGDVMRVSHSYDNGDTWTAPVDEPTLKGHAPHFLKLRGGTHLLTYGDRSNSWVQGRPVAGRMYADTLGWAGTQSKLIYRNPGVFDDMSYPGSVQLADGRILTVYYDRGEGILAGTYLRPDPTRLDLPALYAAGQVTYQTDLNHTAASKPTMGPAAPLDGQIGYWNAAAASAAAPPARYWQLDLGKTYPVTEIGVVLKPGYHESAKVEVSQTGAGDWQTIRTYTMQRTDDYDWSPLGADRQVRYVRVTITDTTGNGHAMFNEIAVRVAPTTFHR